MIDPRTYGAVCNGVTDDTAAIRLAISAAIGVGGIARDEVLIPGVCAVTDTITIASVCGLRIHGIGVQGAMLKWTGADPAKHVLVYDRTQHCSLDSLTISAYAAVSSGIRVINGPGATGQYAYAGLQSSRLAVRDVLLHGRSLMQRGLAVDLHDPAQDVRNDYHSFENVVAVGYLDAGARLQGRNAKNLRFRDCLFDGLNVGRCAIDTASIPNQGASFIFDGGTVQHTEADFIIGDRNDTIRVSGYSEKSARLLKALDYGTWAANRRCPISIQNMTWANGPNTAADGEIVQCETGPLSISGSNFGEPVAGSQVRVRVRSPMPLLVTGSHFANDGNGIVFVDQKPQTDYGNHNTGYRAGLFGLLGAA